VKLVVRLLTEGLSLNFNLVPDLVHTQAAKSRGVKFGRKRKLTSQQIAQPRKMLAEVEDAFAALRSFAEPLLSG
jgi:hypothetical protein